MKILHTEASCGWGGQEIRILEESRGLIGRGHDVTIACPPHARMTEEAARYGVPVIPLPIEFRTFKGFLALRRELAAGGHDVVNTHSSADSWLTALACATLPQPPAIVRTRHISAPVSGNFANRWLYRQVKMLVTTGKILRQDLVARLNLDPDRVVSIPTGIDTERFAPPAEKSAAQSALGLDPAKTHVGIVATLRSWKGHRYLIDALSRLPETVGLLVVGDGPQREALLGQARETGLEKRIRFCGNQADVLPWLQAIDVFVLPSYANEGVPQALMQAMATGLPCVTTAVGSIGELAIAGETALIVKTHDSVALAAAIEHLLEDEALRNRLGAQARAHVIGHYGLDAMLDAMEGIFQSARPS